MVGWQAACKPSQTSGALLLLHDSLAERQTDRGGADSLSKATEVYLEVTSRTPPNPGEHSALGPLSI
jgi:hypothetical protein